MISDHSAERIPKTVYGLELDGADCLPAITIIYSVYGSRRRDLLRTEDLESVAAYLKPNGPIMYSLEARFKSRLRFRNFSNIQGEWRGVPTHGL